MPQVEKGSILQRLSPGTKPVSIVDKFAATKRWVNIVDVIGKHVELKRQGNGPRFIGRCPFHSEKTPSFTVREDWQRYYCFGCNAHGDVVDGVSALYGIPALEAGECIASEWGLDLQTAQGPYVRHANISDEQRITATAFRLALSGRSKVRS